MLVCSAERILAGKILLISLSHDRGPRYTNADRQQEVQKGEVTCLRRTRIQTRSVWVWSRPLTTTRVTFLCAPTFFELELSGSSELVHCCFCVSCSTQPDSELSRERTLSSLFFFYSNLLFIYLFLYLFLAVLGLRFCARVFCSCGKRGPLFIGVRGPLHYRGLSCCGAQAPDAQAQ